MTNASCADCGRIVAFRTHDPSEIAECRNCGTWVKRSADMPGVAVSVKKEGPVARKTAIPPRKDEAKNTPPSSNSNTVRSATKQSSERPPQSGETLSPSAVYASIRDLQKAVYDLRAGQRSIQAEQKNLSAGQKTQKEAQKTLHEGQKALHLGQKQLFGQYHTLQEGQQLLLERTLHIADMPVPAERTAMQQTVMASGATPLGPLSSFDEAGPPIHGFFTTPFSSLKVPLIPIRLEDLDIETQYTEEGSVPTTPVEDRSSRQGLIDGPLPEPPPFEEPAVVESELEEPVAETPSRATTAFHDASFDDSVFNRVDETFLPPEEEFAEPPPLPHEETSSGEATSPSEEDPFFSSAAHSSPFTIEGPPDDPFSIAGSEEEAPEEEKKSDPFAITPQPFGAQEFTHEPSDLEDPFASSLEDSSEHADSISEEGAFGQTPETASFTDDEVGAKNEKSLSQQIADAKEEHQPSPFDPKQSDLLTDKKRSPKLPILLLLIAILGAIGAYLFFFTDIFKGKETATAIPPLIELPARGIPLPPEDERIAEAEAVAVEFLQAKSRDAVQEVIQPVNPSLLVDFWEPITAPTIERLFQGRILENDRVEIDFLINDIKGKERILPLIKEGEGPFQVDWKSFAECEEATLLGLAQGTLILDSGEELTEGDIRSFVQDGKELEGKLDLGNSNYQGFKLHNFTEEVVALGVVRKDSDEFRILTDAFAHTELKHKGKPAIRAVLRVELVEEEDLKTKRPARLEILKVVSINGEEPAEVDDIIQEKLPTVPEEQITAPETTDEAPPIFEEVETPQEPAAEEPAADEPAAEKPVENILPPVPDEDDPLASVPGETPVFDVSYE